MTEHAVQLQPVALVGFGDLAAFQKRLTDSVKAAFGTMIPDDALAKAIEAEWQKFVVGTPEKKDYYGTITERAKPPELNALVHDEMRKRVLLKVQAWGEEWGKGSECSRLARETIEAAAEHAAKTWHANLGASIVSQVMSAMPSAFQCRNCGHHGAIRGQNCGGCGQWVG